MHLEGNGVVFDQASLGVRDICPVHVVTEAPVILLRVEEVGDLPREGLLPRHHREHFQLRLRLARPRAGLALPIALQEVAHALALARPWVVLALSRHDHDLPGKVSHHARRRKHRLLDLTEVVHREAEGRLRARLVFVLILGRRCRRRRRRIVPLALLIFVVIAATAGAGGGVPRDGRFALFGGRRDCLVRVHDEGRQRRCPSSIGFTLTRRASIFKSSSDPFSVVLYFIS